jgi:glycine C-acetyltransferase
MDDANNVIYGINFASTDFLGLAQNSTTKEEAIKAVLDFGCNSAGSPLAFGATKYYRQLRDEIADFWKMKSVMIYSAGWLAGYGVFKGLLKEWDHVVMDELCHNSLQEGASAVTSNVHRFPHLNQSAMEAKLKEIRSKDLGNSIMLVTEGLFYMDSSSPNLVEYQRLAKLYNAYFLISCSNDFGCMGPGGRGIWELQGLKDRSNVLLLGSGSKTLSVNIGFLACDDDHVIEYMKILSTTYMFTNAINPVQANTSLNNLRIIASEHGKQLRK